MSEQPENFEKLQKLLALKRHEQPPPGYFNSFSSKVTARIRAEEEARQGSWWQRLTASFETKPILAGVYGLAMVAMVTLIINVAVHTPVEPVAGQPAPAAQKNGDSNDLNPLSGVAVANTNNPGVPPPPGIFSPQVPSPAVPVGFNPDKK